MAIIFSHINECFMIDHKKSIVSVLDETILFLWRRHPDLNRGIKALQASALPLGYGAKMN